jgi:nitrogen regulatory protein P-II 1
MYYFRNFSSFVYFFYLYSIFFHYLNKIFGFQNSYIITNYLYEETLKKIEAIIRPHKLDNVHHSLQESGFTGLTVIEVKGYGRQKGHKEIYRGSEYNIEFVPKIKIELICPDDQVDTAISIIISNSKTGEVGDGKIFVSSIDEVIRVRTEEMGESAL